MQDCRGCRLRCAGRGTTCGRLHLLPVRRKLSCTLQLECCRGAERNFTVNKVSERITPVILAGGSGTRLWPLSTPERTKQFLELHGEGSMIAQAMRRVADREAFLAPIIVGEARHEALLKASLADAGARDADIILEPCPRNTAPAIALAALHAGEDALLLVMPSDHVICDTGAFLAAVSRALPAALQGRLVTFGIEPDGPETGFGYICAGDPMLGVPGAFDVEAFTEKPDEASARQMLRVGGHFWNAGVFLFRSGVFLAELERHEPEVLEAARTSTQRAAKWDRITAPQADRFEASPSISVDYAVMELSDRVAVVPMSCGWSDLGSWDALAQIGEKDSHGNVFIGDVRADGCSGNLVSASGLRVSAVGITDTIVVVSGEEMLIMPRGVSQRVKDFAR